MEVVAGTYEEVLLGYKIVRIAEKYEFEPSFTDNSHTGCVKTVAVSRRGTLASGSTDESIRLFNLKKRRELGSLVHHSGTVTCVDFYKGSHMFSASEDGTICVWKYFSWECIKSLRGHKMAVNHISVHPSGKLALSVGRDKTLRTWNLITGRSAYITNIKQEASLVRWSLDGEHYAVVFINRIDVYTTQTAAVCCTVNTTQRVNDISFLSNSIMVYGGEGGHVYFYDIVTNELVHTLDTQTNRVRAISFVPALGQDGEETDDSKEKVQWLFTASSDGHIKIFSVQTHQNTVNTALVASHNTTFRLTCMAVSTFKQAKPSKDTSTSEQQVTEKRAKKRKRASQKSDTDAESQDSGVGVSQVVEEDSVEVEEEEEAESDEEKKSPRFKSPKSGKNKKDKSKKKLKQKKESVKVKQKTALKEDKPPKKKKTKT